MLEIELENLRNIVNRDEVFIQKLVGDALLEEKNNKPFVMEVQEQKKATTEFIVKLMSVSPIAASNEKRLEGSNEKQYL